MKAHNYDPFNLQSSPPNLIIDVNHEDLGRLGYLVIDRTVEGTVHGGLQLSPDISLHELASIARTMTCKLAFINVPMGGAAASIRVYPHQLGCDRLTLFQAFGHSIAPLLNKGILYTFCNFTTTWDDFEAITSGSGQQLINGQIDASLCTGFTVFETIRNVVLFNGMALSGLRVAIEGFGKVGSVVAQQLAQAGSTIVAVSTSRGGIVSEEGMDISRLLFLKQKYGGHLVTHYSDAKRIMREALYTQPVDLLLPGAQPHVIHAGNASKIQAKFIVPISNAPVTHEAEQILFDRGVIVMPDFVANCGGVLASDMRSVGFDDEDVRHLVETTFAEVILRLLQRSRRESRSICEIARTLAWQNHYEFSDAVTLSENKISRMSHVLKDQGLIGLWRRLAWRVHRRWPRLRGAVRRAALDRFNEWRLGTTLDRITSSRI